MCLGVGTYPNSVQIPVTLEVAGNSYRARSANGSLSVELVADGTAASGTVRGSADDGSGTLSMSVQGTDPVSLSGQITGNQTASGTVVGNISLMGPHGYGGCSPSNWALMPR